MEIYKDLKNPASKEFEQLLNSQLSKTKIEEGKIIEGKINKITDKFVFLFIDGLKSEPVLDINELKTMGLLEKAKVGEKISVLLERIEDKNGEVLVSASKAQKIKGWDKLVEAYDNNIPVMGKIEVTITNLKGKTQKVLLSNQNNTETNVTKDNEGCQILSEMITKCCPSIYILTHSYVTGRLVRPLYPSDNGNLNISLIFKSFISLTL